MCGICGAYSSILSDSEIAVSLNLLFLNTLRGRDGAGVALMTSKPKVDIMRTTSPASVMAMSPEFNAKIAKSRPLRLFLGHARLPTMAKDDIKAIHPHRAKHIVGVHNGTVYSIGGKTLDKDTSDSALLFQAIAEQGIDEVIKDVRGAYCLVWVDERERSLNFIRNGQRPLSMSFLGDKKEPTTLFWSSTEDMLALALKSRNHNAGTIEDLPTNTLVKYSLDKGRPREMERRKVEQVYPVSTSYGGHRFWDPGSNSWTTWEENYYSGAPYGSNRGTHNVHRVSGGHNTPSSRAFPRNNPAKSINHNVTWFRSTRYINTVCPGEEKGTAVVPLVQGPPGDKTLKRLTSATHMTYGKDFNVDWVMSCKFEPDNTVSLYNTLMKGCAYCSDTLTQKDNDTNNVVWFNRSEYFCLSCVESFSDVRDHLAARQLISLKPYN